MRSQAESRVTSLNVPDASVTTNTSNPSAKADNAGKATQASVTTPAIISCFLSVALTAWTNSSRLMAISCYNQCGSVKMFPDIRNGPDFFLFSAVLILKMPGIILFSPG